MYLYHTNNWHWLREIKVMIIFNKSKDIRIAWMCMPKHVKQVRERYAQIIKKKEIFVIKKKIKIYNTLELNTHTLPQHY